MGNPKDPTAKESGSPINLHICHHVLGSFGRKCIAFKTFNTSNTSGELLQTRKSPNNIRQSMNDSKMHGRLQKGAGWGHPVWNGHRATRSAHSNVSSGNRLKMSSRRIGGIGLAQNEPQAPSRPVLPIASTSKTKRVNHSLDEYQNPFTLVRPSQNKILPITSSFSGRFASTT